MQNSHFKHRRFALSCLTRLGKTLAIVIAAVVNTRCCCAYSCVYSCACSLACHYHRNWPKAKNQLPTSPPGFVFYLDRRHEAWI